MKLRVGKAGFSLVEFMIAAGLTGLVSIYAAQILESSNKTNRDVNYDLEITEVMNNIQFLLAQGNNCNQNFKGQPALIPSLPNIVDEGGNMISQQGNISNGDLRIIDFSTSRVGAEDKLLLTINFRKRKGFLGSQDISREIMINASFDGANNVVNCSSEMLTEASTLVSKLCNGPGRVLVDNGDADPSNDICMYSTYDINPCPNAPTQQVLTGFNFNAGTNSYDKTCVDFTVPVKVGDCPASRPVLAGINSNNTLNCRALNINEMKTLFLNGSDPTSGFTACSDAQFSQLIVRRPSGSSGPIVMGCL
ncbi:MAG: hypothetical protein H6621_05790 [Halobacteriovoraceae bacterium]|nr:hypothetical protein [Halobacteriovoraceae bacterium]